MRPTLITRLVLSSMLLSGVAISSAQANSLVYEISRISASCADLKSQLGMAPEERAVGGPSTVESGLGAHSSISDVYVNDVQPAPSGGVVHQADSAAGTSVNTLSCDGLMASGANEQLKVEPSGHDKTLAGEADSFISQPKIVPLPAVAWLFSSALLGFIVVANRRKI